MLFLGARGFRCIAHDRRGHGRSSQVGSGHDDQFVRTDGMDGHLPAGLGPAGDHEVDQVPVEQRPDLVPVAGLQPDPGQRVVPPEAAQNARHHLLGGRGHGGDPQFSPFRVRAGGGRQASLIEQADDAPDVARVRPARVGEPEPTPVRGDQRQPQCLLQGGQRRRHRRLGDHEFLCRAVYGLVFGHREERAELVQRHAKAFRVLRITKLNPINQLIPTAECRTQWCLRSWRRAPARRAGKRLPRLPWSQRWRARCRRLAGHRVPPGPRDLVIMTLAGLPHP